ncbi:T9SS type B sorting domain-containing protein [Flavobacterium sp.]|uniref:T9SS type B sorting domain-containing protein n=1 Tax=Flavobacterium sp. TaxID=239 RepID=UPI004048DE40
MKLFKFIILFFLFFNINFFAQGGASSCAQLAANPENYQTCATDISFSSSSSLSNENYFPQCFAGNPLVAPSWFILKIDNPGVITLQISQTDSNTGSGIDVDYALYGPFTNLTNLCGNINNTNLASCSYSTAAIENVNIPYSNTGDLYVLIIDNYAAINGQSGPITVTQTSGTGSTDCDFLSLTQITNSDGSSITQTDYCKPSTKDITATIDITNFNGLASNLRFNYTWFRNGIQIGTPITNSNSLTNTITTFDTGTYKVETEAYDLTNPTIIQNSEVSIDLNFHTTPNVSIQNTNTVCLNTNPILNTTITNEALLTPTVDVLTYQWYLNTMLINNATNSNFTPTLPGDYYVVVSNSPCSTAQSNTIRIITNPNISIIDNQTICEGTNYTIYSTNLNSTINNTVTYEWFKDGTTTGITTPNYTVNATNQTINTTSTYYLVAKEEGICNNTSNTVSITVNALPIINTTPILLEQCDFISSTLDGLAETNITSVHDILTNNTPGITLYYYEDIGLNTIITNPTNFINTTAFNQTIYVKAVNENITPNCESVGIGVINLQINPTSTSSYPDVTPVCPEVNQSYGFADFDSQRTLIKNTYFPISNVIITFHSNTSDASTGQNELTNSNQIPIGSSTIYTRVISATTSSCQSIGVFLVTITDPPIQNVISDENLCLLDTFLLNTKDGEILNGQNPSVITTYFNTFSDATNNINSINKNTPLNLTLGTKKYFIRLFDNVTQCFSIVDFNIIVFPIPTIFQPDPIKHCGYTTTNFNLESRINQITGGNVNYQVSFFGTLNDLNIGNAILNTTNYISSTTTIYINIIDTSNNNCEISTTLNLEVLLTPGATNNPTPIETCDDSGFGFFDLTSRENQMAGNTPIGEIAFRYYQNLNDALANNNVIITDPTQFINTQINNQKIYVRLNSKVNKDSETNLACFRILELDLHARHFPKNKLSSEPYIICVNQLTNTISPVEIKTLLNTTDYIFSWYTNFDAITGNEITGQNGNSYNTATVGEYSVKVINISNVAMCESIFNFSTKNSIVPNSITANPSELIAFGIDNTITAIVTPLSNDYLYSIDGIYFQESSFFTNIAPGVHTLKVINKFGCGEASTSIIISDFPSFFTPNGDGYNDTWNIKGNQAIDSITIYIYDRYGKLLKEFSPDGPGWDGTFNGKPLPSTDYWFKLIYAKDNITREYKNHFSLKR